MKYPSIFGCEVEKAVIKITYLPGYQYHAHAGVLFGYDSLMTLYPDMGVGVYTAMNGPGGRDAFIANQLIHYFISDVMLGEQPWLDTKSILTFPEPWLPQEQFVFPSMQVHCEITKGLPASRMLNQYVGTYRHRFLGNIKISVDDANRVLHMSYGKLGQFLLHPDGEEDEFRIEGTGSLWFIHELDEYAPTSWMMVKFTSNEIGSINALICSLFESGPIFTKVV